MGGLRWTRRHRAWAQGIAAILVLLLISTISAVVVERARRAESTALAEARDNFDQARHTVHDFFTAVNNEISLKQYPGLQAFQAKLLSNALKYYRAFARKHPDDARLLSEVGDAQFQLGIVLGELGRDTEATEAYRDCLSVFERLSRAQPDEVRHKRNIAHTHNNLRKPS